MPAQEPGRGLELELKLAVKGTFSPRLPGKAGVAGLDDLEPLDLRATYFDTPDLRLARSGITLRRRLGEPDHPGWTLKLPAGAAGERDELHFDGSTQAVPERARDLVTAFVRSERLAPVARLRTQRRRWMLRGEQGEELAELVDDRVSVLQHGRVVERFREVEVEGRALDRAGLERIATELAKDGAHPAADIPKAIRALGAEAAAPPDVVVSDTPQGGDASEVVRAAIARGVQRIQLNDPRTRFGEVEPLHQMRVGTRRLRSDLRTFAPLLDERWVEELRYELRWLGDALGAVRDLDVMCERLRAEGGELPDVTPLFWALASRHATEHDALLETLRQPRYVELLDRLVEGARRPPLTAAADAPADEALAPLVASSWKRLAKQARALVPESTDEDRHRVRVRAKQARYAAEAVAAGLSGGRRRDARAFAKRAASIQDVLGELQDSVMAARTINDLASTRPDGPFCLAAGRMLEREALARERSLAEFPAVWKRLDRKKRTAWMKA